jgi:histidinol dehydrogenase
VGVGPGNAYVTAAKKLVFGDVGIDSIAGPSEVFIVADAGAPPQWIAADLLAQAEHDADAQSVLITDDVAFARAVEAEVDRLIEAGSAGLSARRSWSDHGAIIIVSRLMDAVGLIDEAAPEHVQIVLDQPDRVVGAIRHAGAIFVGAYAPEALGDYLAGPNHVLPTSGKARFSSGLSTWTFMKRTSIIGATRSALAAVGPAAARIADAEGLPAHAASLRLRIGDG